MLKTPLFLLRLAGATLAVLPLRWLRGRRRPTWSWREEMVWSQVRVFVESASRYGPNWVRRVEPTMAGRSPLLKAVRFVPTEVGGVAGAWCLPRRESVPDRTLVYLHGGAYVMGSVRLYREIVARLALDTRARVLSLDYRLGPEHPFPAAHDDALTAVEELFRQGVAPERLGLVGDSAGGALVLSTLLALRQRGGPLPAGAALFSPWVDPGAEGGSLKSNLDDDVLDREYLQLGIDGYLRDVDLADPRVAPLQAELSGLPPLIVQVGDAEIFLDQDRAFAERAAAAGVDVTLKVYEDLFHTFQNHTTALPRCESAVGDATAFLRSRLASG